MISVIVPVFKTEKYLDRCVKSIVNQTYKNLEIILVDDGSPDNCPQMCDEWAKKDNRIRVIHQKNSGVPAVRNTGLDAATGDYIAFIDSDDWIDLDTYEAAIHRLKQDNLDIVGFGYVDEFYDRSEVHKMVEEKFFIDKIMCGEEMPTIWRYVYKKIIFENLRFDIEEKNHDDTLIIPDIFARVKRFGLVPDKFYHYNRENEQSIMHHYNRYKNDYVQIRALIKMAVWCKEQGKFDLYKYDLAKIYRLGLKCYICDLEHPFLEDYQKKNLLNTLEEIHNVENLDNIRVWDRIKYWSIEKCPFMVKIISYVQK